MMNHAVEIIGQVTPDLSVRVNQALDFGTDYGESMACFLSNANSLWLLGADQDPRLQLVRGACNCHAPVQGDLLWR